MFVAVFKSSIVFSLLEFEAPARYKVDAGLGFGVCERRLTSTVVGRAGYDEVFVNVSADGLLQVDASAQGVSKRVSPDFSPSPPTLPTQGTDTADQAGDILDLSQALDLVRQATEA